MVDTIVRPPVAPPSDVDASDVGNRHRRRWLRWVLAALATLLVGATIAATVVVSNYQPFQPGYKQYGPPKGVSAVATPVYWLGVAPNVEVFRIPAHEGTTFNYRFSLWNHGPVPITITQFGVPLAEQEGDGVTDVPVSMNPNVYAFGAERNWQPVGPITLEPRQMMAVEMHVVVTSCLEQGSTAKWNTIPISFTMYGIHRHVSAPMNVQVTLAGSQTRGSC